MQNDKKLSQIILYVDKRIPEEDICIFRTNVLNERDDIWFTYLNYCYEECRKKYSEINLDVPNNEVIVITDSKDIAQKSSEMGLAVTALITDYNRSESFADVAYCIENIEDIGYEDIERIWKRFYMIPWVIASTKRLIIREQKLEDFEDIFKMYADNETTKYMDNLYEDKDEEREYLREYISSQYTFYEYGIWTLIDKETGKYVGRAGLSLREGYEDIEIGYVITKDYRNKGYAREAIEAIVKYAKEELDISRLIAFVRPQNRISIRLLESIGFKYMENHLMGEMIHNMYFFDL